MCPCVRGHAELQGFPEGPNLTGAHLVAQPPEASLPSPLSSPCHRRHPPATTVSPPPPLPGTLGSGFWPNPSWEAQTTIRAVLAAAPPAHFLQKSPAKKPQQHRVVAATFWGPHRNQPSGGCRGTGWPTCASTPLPVDSGCCDFTLVLGKLELPSSFPGAAKTRSSPRAPAGGFPLAGTAGLRRARAHGWRRKSEEKELRGLTGRKRSSSARRLQRRGAAVTLA